LRKGGGGKKRGEVERRSVLAVTDRRTDPQDAICLCGHPLTAHQGPGESCSRCYGCEEFRPKPKPFDRNSVLGLVLGLAYPWLLVWKYGFGGGYDVWAVALTGLWGLAVVVSLVRWRTQRKKARASG
jgi:hypothetical protein